jgi:hypothetical protein
MSARTVRAVEQKDGHFRIAVEPSRAELDTERSYDRDEVVAIAKDLQAELRWVDRPDATRRYDNDPMEGVADSVTDPWGGDLPSNDG